MKDNDDLAGGEFCPVPVQAAQSGSVQDDAAAQRDAVRRQYLEGGEYGHLDDGRAIGSSPFWVGEMRSGSHSKKKKS